MVALLRADADEEPWRIRERGAPTPGAAIRLLRGWWRSWTSWALRLFGGGEGRSTPTRGEAYDATARLIVGQSSAPPPPPPRAWSAVGARAAVTAAEAERRLLVSMGAPPQVMDRLRPPPAPPAPPRVFGGGLNAAPVEIPIVSGLQVQGIEGRVLAEWAQEGAQLIRRIPAELLADLPAAIVDAAAQGKTWAALRNVLRAKIGHVGEARLELIARDQTAKLNSRITEALQTEAGVTSYTWRANLDERVRATHRAAHGTVVEWASAGVPGTGFYGRPSHAGRGGQCRCTAEPVVPPGWL